MEEYEAYIDKLPERLIKTLEEADGHPPSEEELHEIYEAHKELKRNVEKFKEEMNDKVEKMRILSERITTEKDANPLDLVTELMQSCGIPCDEENDDATSDDGSDSTASNEMNKNNESIESNEVEDLEDWQDGAYGIDFKLLEETRERNTAHEDNSYNLTKRTYGLEEANSSLNVRK